jgi:ubiquinone/menaquinone biosynthesis C-methylase UbiE
MPWWGWLLCLATVAALLYWLVVITEGAYLGSRIVVALYDRYAARYDEVKQFDETDEAFFLGDTLYRDLVAPLRQRGQVPLILDVATGTGRYPLAVLRATQGRCQVWGLDGSKAMLRQARRNMAAAGWPDVMLFHHDASQLCFQDGCFDAVGCLEALEFLPRPRQALRELWRVLRPGGLLMVSNRIGTQAHLMPGRTFSRPRLEAFLVELGAVDVTIRPWQVDYDLATARKRSGQPEIAGASPDDVLKCPSCGSSNWSNGWGVARLTCQMCGAAWVCGEEVWHFVAPGAVERKSYRESRSNGHSG